MRHFFVSWCDVWRFPWTLPLISMWTTFNFGVQHCVDLYDCLNMSNPDRRLSTSTNFMLPDFWMSRNWVGISTHVHLWSQFMCKLLPWAFLTQKRNTDAATMCSLFLYVCFLFDVFFFFQNIAGWERILRTAAHRNWKENVVVVKPAVVSSELNNIQGRWVKSNKFIKAELNLP